MDDSILNLAAAIEIDLSLLDTTGEYARTPGNKTIHTKTCKTLKRAKASETISIKRRDLHRWKLHDNCTYSWKTRGVWPEKVETFERAVTIVVRHEAVLRAYEDKPSSSVQVAARVVQDVKNTSEQMFDSVGLDKRSYVQRAQNLYDDCLSVAVEERYRPYVVATMGFPSSSAKVADAPAGTGIGRYLRAAWEAWVSAVAGEESFEQARSRAQDSLYRYHSLGANDNIDAELVKDCVNRAIGHWEELLDAECREVGDDVIVAYAQHYYVQRNLFSAAANSFRGDTKIDDSHTTKIVLRVPERIAEGLYDPTGNVHWLGLARETDTSDVLTTMLDLWSSNGALQDAKEALTASRLVVAGTLA